MRYQTDLGDLGNRTKAVADALVATAFSTWSGNALINLSTSRTGDLSVDITAANIISSGIFDSVADGKTPIIYDTDGSIISLIAGVGSENFMLGFAGPVVVAPDGEISEGRAVLNGFLLNGETDNAVLTVVTHELGHLLGLAHSQLNQEFFFDGDGPNDVQIPLMFPILRNVDDVDAPITLTKDDVMSAGFLYRTSGFDNNFGHILGGVADANNDEFSGANVVLRRVGDLGAVTLPFLGAPGPDTYSWPSGIRSANGTGGAFEFHLLPEGQYVMFVENINQSFTGGSSVGPFDPPPTGIVPEFYNGDDESSDAFTDDPQAFITINVTTGNFIEGLEFRLQGTSTVQLQLDDTLSSTISVVDGALAATQYQIRTFNATGQVSIELTTENGGDLDLFVRREIGVSGLRLPGLIGSRYPAITTLNVSADFSSTGAGGMESVTISKDTDPPIQPGLYFIGLVNNEATPVRFTLRIQSQLDLSGLGEPVIAASQLDQNRTQFGCEAGGASARPGSSVDIGWMVICGLWMILVAVRATPRKARVRVSANRHQVAGIIIVTFALSLGPGAGHAAGPIDLTAGGLPHKWNKASPVPYNLDLGTLGDRLNPDADTLVSESFNVWTDLPEVDLLTQQGADLPEDVTALNFSAYLEVQDNRTSIIYDSDGGITEAIAGTGASASVLGFAGPEVVSPTTGLITEGVSVLNGVLLGTAVEAEVRTVIVHELGHMLGLAHTQLNQELFFDGNGPNDVQIPIMYPILRNRDDPDAPSTPTADDTLSMAFLYPQSNFDSSYGHVLGRVLNGDGSQFRGANVVLRRITPPPVVLGSGLGFLGTPGPDSWSWPAGIATLTSGEFQFDLLPGGQYEVFIEEIDPAFVGGSAVGPFSTPPTGITSEYFNGANESALGLTDNPMEATTINVTVGETTSGIDIVLQDANANALSTNGSANVTLSRVNGDFPPAGEQLEIAVPATAAGLLIEVSSSAGDTVEVHVRRASPVLELRRSSLGPLNLASDFDSSTASGTASVSISAESNPALVPGSTYYIALVNTESTPSSVTISTTTTLASVAQDTSTTEATATASSGGRNFLFGCEAHEGMGRSSDRLPPLGALLLLIPYLGLLGNRVRAKIRISESVPAA